MVNKTRQYPHPKIQDFRDVTNVKDIWNIFKITGELVEGQERLNNIYPAVSIFGSARTSKDHPYYQMSMDIAELLSINNFNIISGGGPGIMEAVNIGASKGPSLSIGLCIDLPKEPLPNEHQDITLRHRYFFTRKATFIKHSIAYIVMPGGFGTLDELFDILTLIQTEKKSKMPIILVGSDFWSGLVDWLEQQAFQKLHTIDKSSLNLFQVEDDPQKILQILISSLPNQTNHFQF